MGRVKPGEFRAVLHPPCPPLQPKEGKWEGDSKPEEEGEGGRDRKGKDRHWLPLHGCGVQGREPPSIINMIKKTINRITTRRGLVMPRGVWKRGSYKSS